jgi:hypothetical protein
MTTNNRNQLWQAIEPTFQRTSGVPTVAVTERRSASAAVRKLDPERASNEMSNAADAVARHLQHDPEQIVASQA